MIFEPVEPRKIGPLKLQGLFLRRQPEASDVYAGIIADDIITLSNIGEELLGGPRSDRTRQMIETAMHPAVDRAVGVARPAVRVAVGAREDDPTPESVAVQAGDYTETPPAAPEVNPRPSSAHPALLARPNH